MKKVYTLRLNSDETVSVIVGRQREAVGLDGKTKAEIFDAVKWALISKGAWVSDERLTTDLYEALRDRL